MHFPKWLTAIILVLSLIVGAWAALSLDQFVTWDLKNYHLYSGYAFLNKPLHYDFAPAQVQSFYNPLLHLPTYLALEYLPVSATIGIVGAIQGLNLFLVFLIGQTLFSFLRRPLRIFLALCCAAAGFYGAANIGELGTTFADNMLSIPLLVALLLICRHLVRRKDSSTGHGFDFAIAGVLIGAAVGLKLSMGLYAFAAGAALLTISIKRKEWLRPAILFYGSMTAAFLCVYGFWGLNLYLEYGNPFFPYFNEIFQSPYFDLKSAGDPRFFPRTWTHALFYPFYFAHRNNLTCEASFRDIRFAVSYVAILLALTFSIGRFLLSRRASPQQEVDNASPIRESLLFLVVFFSLCYIAWQQLFSVYRYLVPLEMLAPLLIALILAYIIRKPAIPSAAAVFLNLWIVSAVDPIRLGESSAAWRSLKFDTPKVSGLDKSLVLMTGGEPTSYVATRFPAGTRFVRLSSNFMWTSQTRRMEAKIRAIIRGYDIHHTWTYFKDINEIRTADATLSLYGLSTDVMSCMQLGTASEASGLLCKASGQKVTSKDLETLIFQRFVPPYSASESAAALRISPETAYAGKDRMRFTFTGIKAAAIDMLYTLDGRKRPPILNWKLDSDNSAEIPLGLETEKGVYHMIAIRDSAGKGNWIRIDARAEIR